MAKCATRYGSGIEGVLADGIEVLISAEKLRGTHLCLGEIDATPRPIHASEGAGCSEFGSVRQLNWVEMFPVGPPCRARLDLVCLLRPLEVLIERNE